MDHVAILRRSRLKRGDNLLSQIIERRKTIESRWYVNKITPWNKIKKGEVIYFKESGGSVTAKAVVKNVLQFDNLNEKITKEIIQKYGSKIAPDLTFGEFLVWWKNNQKKRYCILVFLKNPRKIPPFEINKKGFGSACAWLTAENIERIKEIVR